VTRINWQQKASQILAQESTPSETLQPQHKLILTIIQEGSYAYVTDSFYAALSKRPKATRTLDFQELIDLGLIERYEEDQKIFYAEPTGKLHGA
jgi:hypothetical protein